MPAKPLEQCSAAEKEFIEQRARQLTVAWAELQLSEGVMPAYDSNSKHWVYLEFAKSKKWVTADGSKMLAAGFLTAARFLKR